MLLSLAPQRNARGDATGERDMTTRQLWRNIMHYGEFDRMPVVYSGPWTETMRRWRREGLGEDADVHEYFQAVPNWFHIGPNVNLYPEFEQETIEETDEYRVVRGGDGVLMKDWKHKSCIPQFIDFTFKTAADWDLYKRRLQPDPARIPDWFDDHLAEAPRSGLPIGFGTGSLMGWIRNWMGVENMSYLIHDDRDCYAEMIDTISDLVCWAIDQVLPRMTTMPDMGFGWEDICYKSGPMIGPEVFNECVAPGYRKIRGKLEQYGITIFGVDSDGMVEPLIPHWLDAGVNLMFPLEVGTWKARPADLRKKFGRELRMMGGFDKLELEKGRAAIDAELARHVETLAGGGFIIMPDHAITPGVSLDDYKYYFDRVRALRF